MKIVIDLDENVFTRLFDNGIEDYAIVNDDLFKIAKSIRTGIPLDKIRAEIEHLTITEGGEDYTRKMAELYSLKIKVLQIIDKYMAESEVRK